ncbi:transcription factor Tfb4 [Hysterangium stoloniferum]|nr:transcription factor Tfb4 [Hysterangium stoloniferum]
MDDSPSHLSLVIDLSPTQWHLCSTAPNPLPLNLFLSHLLTLLNSHVALKHENSIAVFAALPGKSLMLYSSSDVPGDGVEAADSNTYQPFRTIDAAVIKGIAAEMETISTTDREAPCALVGALTKALCYINRIGHSLVDSANVPASLKASDPRILIISVSPDLSTSYIPLMNSIFSAQKLKVTIDVCKLFGPDTVFLQQAAHLTGGSYLYLEQKEALLQYLIMTFLPPPRLRRFIATPTQDKVDFRAACFCHKRIVDIGFVCSVCLSIFCQPVPVCSTCRTKFPMKTLQRLSSSRPPTQTNGTPKAKNGGDGVR